MKENKILSSVNIKRRESVHLTEADHLEARRIENDPAAMLRLVDLIYGPGGWLDTIPS